MKQLSIILPCYNVGKYVRRCLDSCINQDISFDDYEIIAIDDGSKDNTGEILDQYSKRYEHIQVFHKANTGVSDTRNLGIVKSQGLYIWMIDPDDFIDTNCLGNILGVIKSSCADVVWLHYRYYFENGLSKDVSFPRANSINGLSGSLFIAEFRIRIYPTWTFLFKKALWIDNNFKFNTALAISEDLEVIPFVLAGARKVVNYPVIIYNYFQRSDSAVHSKKESKQIHDMMITTRKHKRAYDENPQVFSLIYFSVIRLCLGYISRKNYLPFRKEMLQFFKQEHINSAFAKDGSVVHKIANAVFQISPNLFICLLHRFSRFLIK